MSYAPDTYIHELDRRAFDAVASFPKFQKLREAFSAEFDERAAKINFLSTAIRLNERQMPDVYSLLPPVCEKLGIEIPELYYVQSVEMNAATAGSRSPYIVVTSELVDKLPAELLAAAIAHECGHIACQHYFYHLIARQLMNDRERTLLEKLKGVKKALSPEMVRALLFWDRCSELSADRAAVLCCGDSAPMIDALLKIYGYDERINRDEFLNQAMDLRAFISSSEDNQVIEQMLIQGESHPRLATRAFECAQWAKSEQFHAIIEGTYSVASDKPEEQEVLGAEIRTNEQAPEQRPINLDYELEKINRELDRCTNHANQAHYNIAILSGILAGAIDALFIGDTGIISREDLAFSHKSVNNFIQHYAKARGLNSKRLNTAISELEQTFKVAQDNVWKYAGINVSPKDHHLADLAHHPTPAGLTAALIVQFLRVGMFVNKEGEWHFIPVETTARDVLGILAPAAITGIMNWLVMVAEGKYEEETGKEIPRSLKRIIHLIASTPMIIEVVKCADNWFGHLVSDMGGSKKTAGSGMGIPGVFLSLMYEISSLPFLKDSGLTAILDDMYVNQKMDMRHEIAAFKSLGRQAIPVVLNELYVRTVYFISRFLWEYEEHKDFKTIHWDQVLPFGNRTIDRMLTVASLTFTMADTADAAVHAAIESGGNWVLFSGRFVSRFNYVGAGRAALSIVREVSSEKRQAQLIHEKMILSEMKTSVMMKRLQEYKEALNERICTFLAEDIEAFMQGFDEMQRGLSTGDSGLFIHGNVLIQRVMGREPQFTTQDEFDDLMDSDMALQL